MGAPMPGAAPGAMPPPMAGGGPAMPAGPILMSGPPTLANLQSTFSAPGSGERWHVHKKKMLKVAVAPGQEVWAKKGAMVCYQGDVDFGHKGGGLKRSLKSKVTGEGMSLMKVEGHGDVYFGDLAADIFLIELQGDGISLNGKNVLAMDPKLDWDIQMVKGAGMLASGSGLFNVVIRGTGTVACTSKGQPLMLQAPCAVDPDAAVGWSADLKIGIHKAGGGFMRALGGATADELYQLSFTGSGFVIVQPSEL